jgi:hypothetical protein
VVAKSARRSNRQIFVTMVNSGRPIPGFAEAWMVYVKEYYEPRDVETARDSTFKKGLFSSKGHNCA